MGNKSSPFKGPHPPKKNPRQAHASLSLLSQVGGRESKGGRSPFLPPRRTPRQTTPKFSKKPAQEQGRESPNLTSCLTPLNYILVLCFSQVLPAPSPPTLVNSLGSQLPPPELARRGPACVTRPWQVASVTIPLRSCLPGPGNRAHFPSAPGPLLPMCWRREGGEEPRAGNALWRPTHT